MRPIAASLFTLGCSVVCAPLTAACSDDVRRVEYQNTGTICLFASPSDLDENEPQSFAPDAPATVYFELPDCVNECNPDQVAQCEVRLAGERIEVSSQGGYTVDPDKNDCSLICDVVSATCATPALPRGRYDIVHGEQTHFLDVPGSYQQAPCLGPDARGPRATARATLAPQRLADVEQHAEH